MLRSGHSGTPVSDAEVSEPFSILTISVLLNTGSY